jgi:hypothetical protein
MQVMTHSVHCYSIFELIQFASLIAEIELLLEVSYDDYAAHARAEHTINVNALTTVLESAFTHLAKSELRLKMPDITIQVHNPINFYFSIFIKYQLILK